MKFKKFLLAICLVCLCLCPLTMFGCKKKHTHQMSSWEQTIEPTCTEPGEKRRDCISCDYFEIEEIDPHGHSYSDWQTKTEPSCEKEGVLQKVCSRCGDTITKTTDPLGHNYTGWQETISATCETDGQLTNTCSRCGDVKTQTINKLGHEHDLTYYYDDTNHYYICKRCSKHVDIHQHNLTEKYSTICSVCGYEKVDDSVFKFETPNEQDKTISIIGYNCNWEDLPETLVIPDNYNGYAVTEIGNNAFYNNEATTHTIKTVVLGKNVKRLGDYSFYLEKVSNLVLNDSLQVIGRGAFWGCEIVNLNIPASVKRIETCAFVYNYQLTDVILGDGLEYIGEQTFYGCSKLKNINLGQGNVDIRDYAFYDCNAIQTITGGNNLSGFGDRVFGENPTINYYTEDGYKYFGNPQNKYVVLISAPANIQHFEAKPETRVIAYQALRYNDNLQDITLDKNVVTIDEAAFADCTNLKTVTFGENIKCIKTNAFLSCKNIQTVKTPSIKAWLNINFDVKLSPGSDDYFNHGEENPIYFNQFKKCKTDLLIGDSLEPLTELTIPDDVTEIYPYAFAGYTKLTAVHFGKNVQKVGHHAFEICTNLSTIDIDGTNEYLQVKDNCVVENSTKTLVAVCKNTIIPDGVKIIPDDAFRDIAITAQEIVIPDSVLTIGSYAFDTSETNHRIIFGSGLKQIGENAFYTFKANYVKINDVAAWANIDFGNLYANPIQTTTSVVMEGLSNKPGGTFKAFNIPSTVTVIKPWAFAYLEAYTINIPSETTSIDSTSFAGGVGIYEIIVTDNENFALTSNKQGLIDVRTKTLILTCNSSVADFSNDDFVAIGRYAGYGRRMVNITLPSTVKTIGEFAFFKASINTINLGEGVVRIEDSAFETNDFTTIDIPASTTYIGSNAFYSTKLTTANFAETSGWTATEFSNNSYTADFSTPEKAAQELVKSWRYWEK